METFFEVEFPRKLRYGFSGGPSFYTGLNMGFSGFEQTNRNWSKSKSKWSVSVKALQNGDGSILTDFDLLRNFHLVVGGMADGFRLFEPTDYLATMASGTGILLPGDGIKTKFQLTKTYTIGTRTYTRTIQKPITAMVDNYLGDALTDTVTVYVDGVSTPDYSLDETTGVITFDSAPSNGAIIAADFQFHYPVRFNSDEFKYVTQESDASRLILNASIEMVEKRIALASLEVGGS